MEMKRYLSVMAIVTVALLLSSTAASALSTTTAMIPATLSGSQHLTRESDGRIYGTMDTHNLNWFGPHFWLAHDHDISYRAYSLSLDYMTRDPGTLAGPANRTIPWSSASFDTRGWLDAGMVLPSFWTISNLTNDLDATMGWDAYYFPLYVGETSTVFARNGRMTIGLLNVTTPAEYYNVIVKSLQDGVETWFIVVGPSGQAISGEGYLEDADIGVMPIPFDGLGLYRFYFWVVGEYQSLPGLEVTVVQTTPIELAPGEVARGTLEGSEWMVNSSSGEVMYQERIPSVATFKITPPDGAIGRVVYSFNYPEFRTGTYETHEPVMFVSGNVSQASWIRYVDYFWPTEHTWWYMGIENRSYYVTVMGLDNVEYTILNELVDVPQIPAGEDFYIESTEGHSGIQAFRLHLDTDSVLCINSTEWSSGFSWGIYGYVNNIYTYKYVADSSLFSSAGVTYVPAGDYMLVATPDGSGASGIYRFTVAPVVALADTIPVDDSSLIGVRLPAEALKRYVLNVTLETDAEVLTTLRTYVMTEFGYPAGVYTDPLGHFREGFGWAALGTNYTTVSLGLIPGVYLDGDSFIVAFKPYDTLNATDGFVTNSLVGQPHALGLVFEDYESMAFNGTAELDGRIGYGIDTHSFTLGEPQYASETYLVRVTVNPNRWYNISIRTSDVTAVQVSLFEDLHGRMLGYSSTSMGYTVEGTVSDMRMGFGSLTDSVALVINIDRDPLVDGGFLNITVREMTTNALVVSELPSVPSSAPTAGAGITDWLNTNGLTVGGAAAGVVILVAAAYVIRKRRAG